MRFAIGAPSKQGIARRLLVAESRAAGDVLHLTLREPNGRALPGWTAGAHIDVVMGDQVRSYSLCGDPDDRGRYEIAVLLEADGRGGSRQVHASAVAGSEIRVRGPRNHFRLDEEASRYVLIAGGIGMTPIIAMADRLKRLGRSYTVHYAGRARDRMAFLARLERDHGRQLRVYAADEGARLDVASAVAAGEAEVYGCGPARLLSALEAAMAGRPSRLHLEYFSARTPVLDPARDRAFTAELHDSCTSVEVRADQTLLQALRAQGIDVPSDCEEGLCGSCEVGVLAGAVEHRCAVLSVGERAGQSRMMACCSRARGGSLVLAL